MFQYVLKRVLIMIPTFFVVSIVIFLILNIAPGRPGRIGAEGVSNTSESAGARESYRIFKEQFNLDKPVFWNDYHKTSQEEVDELLTDVVYFDRDDLPKSERPTPAETIKAQDALEDLGNYIVPQLYHAAKNHKDKDIRWYATQRLTVNARRKLRNEFSSEQQSDEDRAYNREVDKENTIIQQWQYSRDAPEETRAEVMAKWDEWYAANSGRFEYDSGESLSIYFLDTRFAKYWGNLVRLDFGVSNIDRKPVLEKIIDKLKYSFTLSFLTVILIYVIAVPLGVFSAVKQNSVADQVITVILFMLYSLPSFFVGVLLLQLLSVGPEYNFLPTLPPQDELEMAGLSADESSITYGMAFIVICTLLYVAWSAWSLFKNPDKRTPGGFITRALIMMLVFCSASVIAQVAIFGSIDMFPTGEFESVEEVENMTTLEHLVDISYHLVLPVFCLTYGGLASLSRYARSGLLDVIRADYIRTARAKGLSEPVVIIKHATRNGMIPILTLLGTMLPALISGSVIIEIIFNIPGMGQFLYFSITTKDYNVVMAILLISSALTLVGLLLSDISYAVVDPRISFK